jgi:predicted dehydrogenase
MPTSEGVLRVAVVGLGHLHPRAYMPLFEAVPTTEVVAVFEPDDALREPFGREFALDGYSDLDEMLEEARPDVAAVFLPHADCPAAAVRCAEKGAHLMVEKPMAADADGAARIVAAAEEHGRKLTTGYCWRLHPVAREIKRIVEGGTIGPAINAEGRCAAGRLHRYLDGHAAWMLQRRRSGGGPMLNLGVHWIDLFRWLLDDEVTEVSGLNVKVNTHYDIEDNSLAHLRFSRGTVCSLYISYTVPDSFPYGRDLYLAVRGSAGVISWEPAYEGEKDVLRVCSDDPRFSGSPRRSQEFTLDPVPGYSGYMGLEYVRAFADSILKDTTPPVTGQDGVAALKVVEAIYRSAAEKRWVEVAQ